MENYIGPATYVIISLFGVGGFAKLLSIYLIKKDTKKELAVVNNESYVNKALIDKSLSANYNEILESMKQTSKENKEEIHAMKTKLDELNNEIVELRIEVNKLRTHLKVVKNKWEEVNKTHPFPDIN